MPWRAISLILTFISFADIFLSTTLHGFILLARHATLFNFLDIFFCNGVAGFRVVAGFRGVADFFGKGEATDLVYETICPPSSTQIVRRLYRTMFMPELTFFSSDLPDVDIIFVQYSTISLIFFIYILTHFKRSEKYSLFAD